MLRSFLTNLRKQRSIGSSKALQELGQGWTAEGEGILKKEFKFPSFDEASNFMLRYSNYCHKVNLTPQWSNVYNTVNVTLENKEFNQISTKELEVAKYLDVVEKVRLPQVGDTFTVDAVVDLSQVREGTQVFDSVKNNQDEKTPLFGTPEQYLNLRLLPSV